MARAGGTTRPAASASRTRPPSTLGSRSESAARPAATSLSQTQLLLAGFLPVVAAVLVYLPALRNGFIWDDPLVLQQLRAVHSLHDILVPPPIVPKFYFRPLISVSYLIDRALVGETPFWFHASVIAFHALNTLLVFVLARRLFPTEWQIAGGGALLFAVFPTHVESVAWMAGRSDVIVCAFVLLTMLFGMDRSRPSTAWLAGLTFLLGALSKESALACMVLLPLLDALNTRHLYWTRYVPLMLAAAAYFALRTNALSTIVGGVATSLPPLQLGLDLVRALGFYVVKAIVPAALCAYIPEVPTAPVYLVVGLITPPLSLALIALALRRETVHFLRNSPSRRRHNDGGSSGRTDFSGVPNEMNSETVRAEALEAPSARLSTLSNTWPVAFLVAWFFVTLAPSLTVIVRRSASAVVADRYLYVPSVASCVLLVWALMRLAQGRRLALRWPTLAIVALSAVYAVATARYTRAWADDLTFWSDVAAKVPADALPQRELANAFLERGKLAEAERALLQALAGKSDAEGRAMAYSNLGNLYRRQGRFDAAQLAFESGLKFGTHPALLHNLGMTLMARIQQEQQEGDRAAVLRDIAKARDAFESALKIGATPGASNTFLQQWDPAKTHALLGQVLFSLGERAAAREHLEEALRLEPTGPVADATRQYMQNLKE